ncbi:MAG: hypothetical protein PHE84_14945 [bacterium]|nr:hypothetical protein [bacterium]
MAVFDPYIKKIDEYRAEMKSRGRQVREFEAQSVAAGRRLRLDPAAKPAVILREDSFLELGSPKAGSCTFTLWTENTALIEDGKIVLIGPDIPEAPGRDLPFGQVLLLGGESLDDQEYDDLEVTARLGYQIEGYMPRSTARDLWARVNRKAVAQGFGFAGLGQALMTIYKNRHSRIQSMAVLFVTASKEDVKILDDIATQVQKIEKEISRKNWQIKGHDLDCSLDCDSCLDKSVCDTIREVLKIRKAKKAAAVGC